MPIPPPRKAVGSPRAHSSGLTHTTAAKAAKAELGPDRCSEREREKPSGPGGGESDSAPRTRRRVVAATWPPGSSGTPGPSCAEGLPSFPSILK